MGNITINSGITGGGGGSDTVKGASNLTTVGAIPYVSAAGILNQSTSLNWSQSDRRLWVGSASGAGELRVDQGSGSNWISLKVIVPKAGLFRTDADSFLYYDTSSGSTVVNNVFGGSSAVVFSYQGNEAMRIPSTRNLLIGTTTDSNFKLDVATSGSAGTARFYGGSGVADKTKVVVQAGAGQSTTNLTEWQDSAGAVLSSTSSSGGFNVASVSSSTWWNLSSGDSANQGIEFSSTVPVRWSNATGNYAATKDLGLARNAAGVLEVNNGTAGTYRDLILRRSQHNGVTVADLPAAAAGNAGSIQYVTNANATTIGSTVAGGGANKVMVWSDGAAWKIFAS